MYRALIFDFDYTLGDTTLSICESINYALTRMGYAPHSTEEIRKTIGYSLNITFRMLTGDCGEEKERLFFEHFVVKADEIMTQDARLYEGAEELLRAWSERYRLAIVSTKHRVRITDILAKFRLDGVVPVVVGNEDVGQEKPHPEGLLLAAEKLQVPQKDALYIGDSVVDAEAAARAKIDFSAVLTGTTPREAFEPFPHVAICENLAQLSQFLKNVSENSL